MADFQKFCPVVSADPHLDQLVILEVTLDIFDHGLRAAIFPYLDNGVQMVGEAAKVAGLFGGKLQGSLISKQMQEPGVSFSLPGVNLSHASAHWSMHQP